MCVELISQTSVETSISVHYGFVFPVQIAFIVMVIFSTYNMIAVALSNFNINAIVCT